MTLKKSVPVTSESLQHRRSLHPKHSSLSVKHPDSCTSVISRGIFSSFSDNKWKWMHVLFFIAGGPLVTDGGTGVWRAVIGSSWFLHCSHWLLPQIHLSHYIQNLTPPYRMGRREGRGEGILLFDTLHAVLQAESLYVYPSPLERRNRTMILYAC